jgi:hypothetical protein
MGFHAGILRESALSDDDRSHFLSESMDANACRLIIASMLSYASCDYAMINLHSFPDPWIFTLDPPHT